VCLLRSYMASCRSCKRQRLVGDSCCGSFGKEWSIASQGWGVSAIEEREMLISSTKML
jgi:hypothetical protein